MWQDSYISYVLNIYEFASDFYAFHVFIMFDDILLFLDIFEAPGSARLAQSQTSLNQARPRLGPRGKRQERFKKASSG